jgi:hypothetical protein
MPSARQLIPTVGPRLPLTRHVHNDRPIDALGLQAFAALHASPGARRYYD